MTRSELTRRPGRLRRLLERIVLGTLVTVGVAAVERRLRRSSRRR